MCPWASRLQGWEGVLWDVVNREIFLAKSGIKMNIKYEAEVTIWGQYILGVEVGDAFV